MPVSQKRRRKETAVHRRAIESWPALRLFAQLTSISMAALAIVACTGGVSGVSSESTTPSLYTVGGSVSGLTGSGLVLQNNNGDSLPVAADGSFTFATSLATGNSYNVSVASQPATPTQTCVPGNAIGTVGATDITGVTVVCNNKVTVTDTIGGTVSGLTGTGLVIQNNGGDDLHIGDNGPFTFATPIAGGSPFVVSVLSPPTGPDQNCVVSAGKGTAADADVNNVSVTCTAVSTTSYSIGGTVSGLPTVATLLLQNNGRDDLTISTNGSFTFATPIPSGTAYSVTVSPTSATSLACAISNPSGLVHGTAINNIAITCTPQSQLTVTVVGLSGTGLVLETDDGDTLAVSANGTATFRTALGAGASYTVDVRTQPTAPAQNCTIANAAGTVGSGTTPTINCVAVTYTIGGTVTGLSGTGLVLQDNGGDNLPIAGNGTFTFPTTLPTGAAYSVAVLSQPTGTPPQTCTVTNGTGQVTNVAVSVTVTCVTNLYTVNVAVSGLTGYGLVLQNSGTNNLSVGANGTFSFKTAVASGAPYSVTVLAQPTNPSQTCTGQAGSGTVTTADVTVTISCTTNQYSVGGTVSGLSGSGLVMKLSTGATLSIMGNGTFAFLKIDSGTAYTVSVITQPSNPTQTCSLANASGTVTSVDIRDVVVTCNATFTVSGIVQGVSASGLTLQSDSGITPITAASDGTATFSFGPYYEGSTYSVTVKTPPTGEICTVTNSAAVVSTYNVTNVFVQCAVGAWASIEESSLGDYGSQSVAASTNRPPSRDDASSWTDSAGNLWMFGGYGVIEAPSGTSAAGMLNDLWEYSPETKQWTWISGQNSTDSAGSYPLIGSSTPDAVPSARRSAASWIDGNGVLWLFGGYASHGNYLLNDMWSFCPNTAISCALSTRSQWTWWAGTQPGASQNSDSPSGRLGAAAFLMSDKHTLWLFGGSSGVADTWEFITTDPATGQPLARPYWVKVSDGSSGAPPARTGAASWVDEAGKFWLYGGEGDGILGDLWSYSTSDSDNPNHVWTQQSTYYGAAYYGYIGIAGGENQPGPRTQSATWTDGVGNLWLFGGYLSDSQTSYYLNDLWRYDVAVNEWTWIAGSSQEDQAGASTGIADYAVPNSPSATFGSASWYSAGTLWLFGGNLQMGTSHSPDNELWNYEFAP